MESDLLNILSYITPSGLTYTEWLNVGMALKHEGYTAADWDSWSHNDQRYVPGECFRKWTSFSGSGTPVTGGTIVQMAKDYGWETEYKTDTGLGYALDWDSTISRDYTIIDNNWLEAKEVTDPTTWDPIKDLIKYLETLFQSTENVGYVTSSWEKDGKFLPSKGHWDRTAGELIQKLSKCNGDIGSVLGDYKDDVGAWIRFNPLDGVGCKDENVTDLRFALVESDVIEIDKQNAIIRELELPVACLVHSGGKSLHAIVKVDAANKDEYRKRVDYLYNVCLKNGLKIDSQNRNPSRLSRMPGVMRRGNKQFLVDTNIGKGNWAEWHEWIEGINDDLPEPEPLTDVWDDLPELAPPLIHNILRQGHKMLIAGPSKAGKSFALIEMAIAIAEGGSWLGWQCTQGRVLYVNLELDRASCLHRFRDVYKAIGKASPHIDNIDIWNLRGKSVPMDKLAPKLIRRAQKKEYIAIIIDPIYKVITGDENSADQMAHFCNQFDRVCTDLGAAVIYCHHHSKGAQGGKKAMDRSSGSGVFARDPDALLDLIELDLTDAIKTQETNKAICRVAIDCLDLHETGWDDDVGQDDYLSSSTMIKHATDHLRGSQLEDFQRKLQAAKDRISSKSAWRIDGALREFPKFETVNVWFDYPTHPIDKSGCLKDINPESDVPSWRQNFTKKKAPEERQTERKQSLEMAYSACDFGEDVTVSVIAEYMGTTEKTVRNRLKEHGGFWIEGGTVGKKSKGKTVID